MLEKGRLFQSGVSLILLESKDSNDVLGLAMNLSMGF
jgi:hypothetical protein